MHLPPNSRYYTLGACAVLTLLCLCGVVFSSWYWLPLFIFGALSLIGLYDLQQSRHAIQRNYPILAHLRFFFEYIRPEIRQYFIESDTEAMPFSRNQRSIVYQRAKMELDKRPFGTPMDVYEEGYEWINHSLAPTRLDSHDFRIDIGRTAVALNSADSGQLKPGVTQPYSASIFNISAMSFGALSANAIRSLNQGAKKGGFAHDTGEGSISRYHREFGGDLIWEIGSGYFGCCNPDGSFSAERFVQNATDPQVKMIEIKLSQGAKPGHGGVLPGAKVTPEIAAARGVAIGVDCVSPAAHSAFSTPIGLLLFVEQLRTLSGGKPTGFKLCIGHPWEWFGIAKAMLETGITPDFIVVDGKEGGTGAAPVEFTDHVGVPLQEGLLLVHNTLVGLNLRKQIRIGAAGKVVTAFDIARMMALGADWCNAARGFMFALGCIQAQSCHTGKCPTGVTTQDPVRQRALVVPDKAERVYNFHRATLAALAELTAAAGLRHPAEISPHHIVRRVTKNEVALMSSVVKFLQPGSLLEGRFEQQVFEMYWDQAQPDSFAAKL
jgi:glutamate synthase domain-containing protein 2